jgi:hypothetical protein
MNDSHQMRNVYDPRGVVEAQAQTAAARAPTLKGLRLAILDNTKWNAGKLLRDIQGRLMADSGLAQVNYYHKQSFSKNATPELIDEIAANNDVVITAIGD